MKLKASAFLLCLLTVPMARASSTILPDACGDDKVRFEVKTEKGQPAPGAPDAGKALLVVAQGFEPESIRSGVVTRLGMDGAWVGANKGRSYFAVPISAGEHHLCVSPQSMIGRARETIGQATFTAEAGKIYYFQATITVVGTGGGQGGASLSLDTLKEDDGKYRVKAWELATSKPK